MERGLCLMTKTMCEAGVGRSGTSASARMSILCAFKTQWPRGGEHSKKVS